MHPVKLESVCRLQVYKTLQPEEHGTWLCTSSCSSHLRIPSAMQAARNRASPTGHGGFSGFNSEFHQSDPGFSWTSTYTPRSRVVNKKVRSSRSIRGKVAALAGSCTKCFAPPRSEIKEAHENTPIDGQDVTISPSKLTFFSPFIRHVKADSLPVIILVTS